MGPGRSFTILRLVAFPARAAVSLINRKTDDDQLVLLLCAGSIVLGLLVLAAAPLTWPAGWPAYGLLIICLAAVALVASSAGLLTERMMTDG